MTKTTMIGNSIGYGLCVVIALAILRITEYYLFGMHLTYTMFDVSILSALFAACGYYMGLKYGLRQQ